MSQTKSASKASTFTEARAREVMRKVHDDFMQWASANLILREKAQEWFEDLTYAVMNNVVDTFQIQLTKPDGTRAGLSYVIRDDGAILEDSDSGGFDAYGMPEGTRFGLCFSYRAGAVNIAKVDAYLTKQGWTSGGSLIEGGVRDRSYSKGGYGAERNIVGVW